MRTTAEAGALVTAADLWRMGARDHARELVRGRLVEVNPPGWRHGDVVAELVCLMRGHARSRDLGLLLTEAGVVLSRDPDTVRGPDIAFVTKARAPVASSSSEGYLELAPDLVVEVVSPNDTYTAVLAKVEEYLTAGVREVWLVDASRRRAEVHRAGAAPRMLGPTDALASDLLPGLAIRLDAVV